MIRSNFLATAMGLAMMVTGASVAWADDVLLTLTGDVKDGSVEFTEQDLLALPQQEFTTETIWTAGEIVFAGPALKDILEAAEAGDGKLSLSALNDYTVELPADVVEDTVPIVAVRKNGQPYGVREKGPIWLVFPYDGDAKYRTEAVYSYSIWQLVKVSVAED
jgi:hypothetical protein